MTRNWFVYFLLSPSLMSGTACAVLAAAATVATAWAYIMDNQLFYSVLFGPQSAATALVTAPDSGQALQQVVLASPLTYYVMLTGAALAIGLAVFAMLQGGSATVRRVAAILKSWGKKDAVSREVTQAVVARLAVRVFSLLGWALYAAFFAGALAPFCAILINGGTVDIAQSFASGWWLIIAGFSLLLVSLHMHVIFARMVLLKPRAFSSNDILLYE